MTVFQLSIIIINTHSSIINYNYYLFFIYYLLFIIIFLFLKKDRGHVGFESVCHHLLLTIYWCSSGPVRTITIGHYHSLLLIIYYIILLLFTNIYYLSFLFQKGQKSCRFYDKLLLL